MRRAPCPRYARTSDGYTNDPKEICTKTNGPHPAQNANRRHTWIEIILKCPRLRIVTGRLSVWNKGKRGRFTSQKVPRSPLQQVKRQKACRIALCARSLGRSQLVWRKPQRPIITHDGARRIKSAKDARKLCDVENTRSGEKEEPDKRD